MSRKSTIFRRISTIALAILTLVFASSCAMAAVKITSPTPGSTVASPVHFVAYASSTRPISAMRIYVDNVSAYTVAASSLDTYLPMSSGKHYVVIQAWDYKGVVSRASETVTVSGTSAGTVTVTSPTSGSTSNSPLHFVASAKATNPITAMRIYLDNTSVYTVAASNLDTYVAAAAGNHYAVVQAWDSTGAVYKSALNVSVATTNPPPPTAPVAVAISPNSATVQVGKTQQFTSSVTGTTNAGVNWSVNGVLGGDWSVGTITSGGLYTAPQTVPNPAVTVTGTSVADTSKSASATVTVTAPAPVTSAADFYGSTVGADSLANTPVTSARSDYRFRASTSSSLNSIRIFLQDGSGYSSGNGGTIRADLQTDDGSANHLPSGSTLASATVTPGNPASNHWPLLTFSNTPQLTAGELYHIVFSNLDASPGSNFTSLNGLYQPSVSSSFQPKYPDTDWVMLYGNSWGIRPITPIMQLNYGNGVIKGIGYMECWISSPQNISGNSKVGELMTITGTNQSVSGASVRVSRTSGSSPLTLRLEDGNGNLIDQASVPASSVGSGMTWVKANFANRQTLNVGQTYRLVLTAPSDTVYAAFPLRDGTSYGFSKGTVFADGYAQFNSGSGWVGWTMWGSSNRNDGDLQFYFLP